MNEDELRSTLKEIKDYSLLAAKEMLSIEDTSLLTGFKPSYIRKIAQQGRLPYYKPFGKQLFFKKSEINEILQTKRVPSVFELVK